MIVPLIMRMAWMLAPVVALVACAVTLPPKGPMPAGASWSGSWDTTYGKLTLAQTGDQVQGTYDGYGGGKIAGRMVGNTLEFDWEDGSGKGLGAFVMSADGASFEGAYGDAESRTSKGGWSGTLLERPNVAAAPKPPEGPETKEVGPTGPLPPPPPSPPGTHACASSTAPDCASECEKGNGVSCHNLSVALDKAGDKAGQLAAMTKACDLGVMPSCSNLALAYANGKLVPRDDKRAFALWTKACEGALGIACYDLAIDYGAGAVVAKDEAKYVSLLQRSCELGHPRGCFFVGQLYAEGKLVPQDLGKAGSLYTTACAAGYWSACSNLGSCHQKATCAKKDDAAAVRLFSDACHHGIALACDNAAGMYARGEGTSVDKPKAVEYLRKACKGGISEACADLKKNGLSL